jgi:adenosylhomocysteine nucleosidase
LKILVTFALENEFAPWRAMRNFRAGSWGAASAYITEIGGAEVGVLLTGIGQARAGVEASKVVWGEYNSIEVCISTGLAGALRAQYSIGQVLAAKAIVSERVHADRTSNVLESSASLVSFASDCGATVVDSFYSSEHVVATAHEKSHLGLSADAVEMESYSILSEASGFGVPCVAIRAVSDAVDEDLPLDMSGIFDDEGQVSIPRVLGQVALHPGAVPGLVKLGKQSKIAAESLARFLDQYVGMVAARMNNLESKAAAATPFSGQ